jgi:hypothetical protein
MRSNGGLRGRVVVVATVTALVCVWLCASALADGDVNVSSCPSETEASPGFRSSLPDCRAYELVSPVYGAGSVATRGNSGAPVVSPSGEQVMALSFGAFAGTEDLAQASLEYGAFYEFARTQAGWTAEAQEPPASLYPWAFPVAYRFFSPVDPARSVWEGDPSAHPGEELEDRAFERLNNSLFLLREPVGGGKARFASVGPVAAPGHEPIFSRPTGGVEGMSDDLAHIVFTVNGEAKQFWPGDGTLEELYNYGGGTIFGRFASLYEYDGADGGEPVLVGVKNVGAPPWRAGASHINEGADLASDCGTGFDGISATGERVFFTAQHAEEGCVGGSEPAVNELYARVDGSETINISEPSTGAGGDCEECKESEPKPAGFAGSSEDGSRVFFTSEQKLLPGAKGDSLFEYDFVAAQKEQRVTLVAPEVTSVAEVAKDGGRVYFKATGVLTSTPNENGEAASEVAGEKLYAYDTETGEMSFVAAGEGAGSFDTTSDGQFVVFETATDLKGTGDRSTVNQLFEYDTETGGVARVSVGQRSPGGYECEATGTPEEGYDCNGNTNVGEDAPRMVPTPGSSVSENGTVVFTSQLALTPQAVSGAPRETENVYEYRGGQVYLISPGNEAEEIPYEVHQERTRLFGIDESGKDVFFSTADSLVPQDTDTQFSWYDAREDGGFPAPAATPGCSGETCQGPLAATPLLPPLDSETATGGGNVPVSSGVSVVGKPKTAAQVRAERLAKALKACKGKHGKRTRVKCEKAARKKYGPPQKAKKSDGGRRG